MTETTEKTLSRRETHRALRLSIGASCGGMVWVAVALGMPLTMLLEALGASGAVLGLAMTTQQAAMSFQLAGGILANRMRNLRRVWFAFALPHRLLWFLIPLLIWMAPAETEIATGIVMVVAISAILANLASPAWFGWMSALVPARESGRFWSVRQAFTMTAFLAATAASGWLLDLGNPGGGGAVNINGFIAVFAIAAIFGTADVLVHFRVPAPGHQEPQTPHPLNALAGLLRDRNFLMLTIAFSLWGISLGISSPFSMVYLKRAFTVSYSQLAAMTIAFSLGSVIAGMFWGRIMDTVGARSFGSIMLLAIPVFSLPWFLLSEATYDLPVFGPTPEAVVVYTLINFFSGAFFSGVALCQINLLTTLATPGSRTIAMALHFTITGLAGASGPAIGGWIMDGLTGAPMAVNLPRGIEFSFFHVQILLHIALAMAATWMFHKTSPTVTDVPIRLLIGNPLRTLTIIQNLITVSTPRHEHARARAIARLGTSRAESVTARLEQSLNDPSPRVRRAAVNALGQAGSAAGAQVLIRHYRQSGDTDVFPDLASALGACGDESGIPVLLEMLNAHADSRLAAIRALGRIGRAWVRQPLINLLQRSEDPDIIEAAGSALAAIAARQLTETRKQADKARKLARENSDFAVAELIKSLSDPAPEIQEATIAALSGIRSPAAIHALLQRLRTAETAMRPRIARALARSHNPDGVPVLLEHMTDAAPEDQIENARALGDSGDRRASGILMDLVRHSDDQRVLSASSEALVHLREIAAFYDIIPRMKSTSNPLLRRTLAVAAGNLLGEGGSFYAFLIQEENLPGSQTSRRIQQIARRIHRLCAHAYADAEASLMERLQMLEQAFEQERWPDAIRQLFDLALALATLTYGREHHREDKVFVEQLIWQNEHIGVCVWFLYMIIHEWNNPAFGEPTQLDALLGLFALTEWNP